MPKTQKVYLTITIDTECDHDPHWIRSKPLAFESIYRGLPEILQPAYESVGAIPTYLLTVEVMEDAQSVQVIRNLKGSFELGTHLHAAFIEPQKKFYDYAGVDSPDFQCSYPPEIEFEKLRNLTELFQRSFGYAPLSFRAGRYGANQYSISALERLGYRVDTSVTPHLRWTEPNGVVDFRRAPEQPYFPSHESLSCALPRSEKRSILEVPVTVKPKWFRGPSWFRPWFSSVDHMKEIVRYHLKKYASNEVIVLNMMFHSMEVIPKASPYPQNEQEGARFVSDMVDVLSWCRAEGVQFVPLKELANIWA